MATVQHERFGGRFVVEREVASGGMGLILRARDTANGDRRVAIKVVTALDDFSRARFERECTTLARLDHPNVVRYVAHGGGAEPWLAMEWLDGADLSERLARDVRPSVADVVTLGRGIAGALGALHALGVVHRDIKPANVFLVDGDVARVKLIDLGIARDATLGAVTGTGVLVGTPFYMAPEQARSDRVIGPAADVFALGCVLYECLTGASPFEAEALATSLVRILFVEPPPLATARADVPEALATVIMRMLRKAAVDRPGDGDAALAALAEVPLDAAAKVAGPGIGHGERRVLCVLLVRGGAGPERAPTLFEATDVEVSPLLDGSYALVAERGTAPVEAAARLASRGLRLLADDPTLALELRTERTGSGEITDAGRRAHAGGAVRPGELVIDEGVAALLESRFVLARGQGPGQPTRVVGRRAQESVRMLLGRATRMVGRKRDLALLRGTLDECADGIARAVVVSAPAGFGKTRLVHELLAEVGDDVEVLRGAGDALSESAPYRTLAAVLAHVPFVQPEVVDDPAAHAQSLRNAFCDWLAERAAARPVLLVIEDAQWADLPSLRLVDAALDVLASAPLCVVVLARPEMKARFPSLFAGKPVTEHPLEPLPARAAAELVKQCLPHASAEVVDALVRRADGHAFFLEELIRSVAEGGTALPESVLALIQARLDAVGADGRRVLRAASVFGPSFTRDGLAWVLEGTGHERWLEELVARDLIAAQGEDGYRFRQMLVRDGAYASLTDEDRAAAHRRAGEWLVAAAPSVADGRAHDALALAHHFRAGGELAAAGAWLARAAEDALAGNDLDAAVRHAEEAERLGAVGPDLGRALTAGAVARYWLSDYVRCARELERALDLLEEGSGAWYHAAGYALVAVVRRDEIARFDSLRARIDAVRPLPGAESEALLYRCREGFQLLWLRRVERVESLLATLPEGDTLDDDAALDARAKAQLYYLRGVRAALLGDIWLVIPLLTRASLWFERAGDTRNVLIERSTLGRTYSEVGAHTTSLQILRDNLEACLRHRASAPITYARVNLVRPLIMLGDDASRREAREVLARAIADTAASSNVRLEGMCHAHVAELELLEGRFEAAAAAAQLGATKLAAHAPMYAWPVALHARALLALGRRDEALARAREAMRALDAVGHLVTGESLPPLVLAQCLAACGLDDEAAAAARAAIARLERCAERIPDPVHRAGFLAMPVSRDTLALRTTTP